MVIAGASAAEMALLKNILSEQLSGYAVFAFGSRVSGGFRTNSDLDLLIEGSGPVPLGVLGELRERLEQSDLSFRVDLLDASRLSPEILKSIKNQKIVSL
jgi:predicted nucleotidyltransferase